VTPVTWTEAARGDRWSHITYIAADSPSAAISVGDAIDVAMARLAEFPEIGRPGRVSGTRELVIARTPYVAVYRLFKGGIQIIRLLHGAQRWPPPGGDAP
jgi:toxin ParE1/3/4